MGGARPQPRTPAPRMRMRRGHSVSFMMWSEVMMRLPSTGNRGSSLTTAAQKGLRRIGEPMTRGCDTAPRRQRHAGEGGGGPPRGTAGGDEEVVGLEVKHAALLICADNRRAVGIHRMRAPPPSSWIARRPRPQPPPLKLNVCKKDSRGPDGICAVRRPPLGGTPSTSTSLGPVRWARPYTRSMVPLTAARVGSDRLNRYGDEAPAGTPHPFIQIPLLGRVFRAR